MVCNILIDSVADASISHHLCWTRDVRHMDQLGACVTLRELKFLLLLFKTWRYD